MKLDHRLDAESESQFHSIVSWGSSHPTVTLTRLQNTSRHTKRIKLSSTSRSETMHVTLYSIQIQGTPLILNRRSRSPLLSSTEFQHLASRSCQACKKQSCNDEAIIKCPHCGYHEFQSHLITSDILLNVHIQPYHASFSLETQLQSRPETIHAYSWIDTWFPELSKMNRLSATKLNFVKDRFCRVFKKMLEAHVITVRVDRRDDEFFLLDVIYTNQ